jgi:hypothetical protein
VVDAATEEQVTWPELLSPLFDHPPEPSQFPTYLGHDLMETGSIIANWPSAHWNTSFTDEEHVRRALEVADMWIGRIFRPEWVVPRSRQLWAGYKGPQDTWKAMLYGGWPQRGRVIRVGILPFGTLVGIRPTGGGDRSDETHRVAAALALAAEMPEVDRELSHYLRESAGGMTTAKAAWNDWRDLAIITDGTGVVYSRNARVRNTGSASSSSRLDPTVWFGAR